MLNSRESLNDLVNQEKPLMEIMTSTETSVTRSMSMSGAFEGVVVSCFARFIQSQLSETGSDKLKTNVEFG